MPHDIWSVTEILMMTNLVCHQFLQAGVEASQRAIKGTSWATSGNKAQALSQKEAQEEHTGPKKLSTTAVMTPVMFAGYRCRLPVKPTLATAMWNAWHALGNYHAKKPIEGEILALEKDFSGWHQMYSRSERKHFWCWKIAIECILEEIAHANSMRVLDELDTLLNLSLW